MVLKYNNIKLREISREKVGVKELQPKLISRIITCQVKDDLIPVNFKYKLKEN